MKSPTISHYLWLFLMDALRKVKDLEISITLISELAILRATATQEARVGLFRLTPALP